MEMEEVRGVESGTGRAERNNGIGCREERMVVVEGRESETTTAVVVLADEKVSCDSVRLHAQLGCASELLFICYSGDATAAV